MKKRALALLLSVVMIASVLPMAALAAQDETAVADTTSEVVETTPVEGAVNNTEDDTTAFADVDSESYYAGAVAWAVTEEITTGTTSTTFSPDDTCTRAQAVTFLWRANGSPEPTATENPFEDVAEGEYYFKAVLWAVEKGITTGASATTFDPDGTCTRGQIVAFQYRAAGSPETEGENIFTDVADDAYYAAAVLWAAKENITTGATETTFAPAGNCTRGQIVTFLFRQLGQTTEAAAE